MNNPSAHYYEANGVDEMKKRLNHKKNLIKLGIIGIIKALIQIALLTLVIDVLMVKYKFIWRVIIFTSVFLFGYVLLIWIKIIK